MGFPIRKFSDQNLHTAPRNLSQYITSFIGFQCQGIHQTPLNAWFMHRKNFSVLIEFLNLWKINFSQGYKKYWYKLTMWKNFSKIWWRIAGSNRWPPECKSGALPAELIPLIKMVGRERLELSTPPLSRVCSNQLSYRPFCWMNSFTNIRDKEEKRGRLLCTC